MLSVSSSVGRAADYESESHQFDFHQGKVVLFYYENVESFKEEFFLLHARLEPTTLRLYTKHFSQLSYQP